MATILDTVEAHLGPGTVHTISKQLESEPGVTERTLALAIPVLLGALSHQCQRPDGARTLLTQLDDHQEDLHGMRAVLDGGRLGVLLGTHRGPRALGPALAGLIDGRDTIVQRIFGERQAPAEDAIARATGMSRAQVRRLLTILAPIVLGALAQRKQHRRMDADALRELLEHDTRKAQRNAARQPEGGLLGGLFSQLFGAVPAH